MSKLSKAELNKQRFNELYDAINVRFPNAKFKPSCFKTIEEIETKIVCDDDDEIIYSDGYMIDGKKLLDFFIVKKKENQEHIYYKDVIDTLIEKQFVRNDCNFKYLERIDIATDFIPHRNENSIKIYASFWGS